MVSKTDAPTLPRYSIQVDEEGYPYFDGLRVQDEELLHLLMSHIRRATPGVTRSPLVTICEGETCLINAFDAPLVAVNVDAVDKKQSTWIFPGHFPLTVPHASLQVDEWNRLHAFIGPEQLPAVLSRKAQAELLNRVPENILKPVPFRSTSLSVSDSSYWSQAFRDKQDGWEMGNPTPVLTHHWAATPQNHEGSAQPLSKILPPKAAIAVPGAGRGHDAHFLASQGAVVTAVDFSEVAESEFKMKYPQSPVIYQRDDIFNFLKKHVGQFDGVFEHTILCAIDPARRREYFQAIFSALKPGGVYFGVFFLLTHADGPPFGLTQWELREHTKTYARALQWEVTRASHPARLGQELWAVLQKR